jgi:predicted nucleotidyltransferase
MKPAVAELDDLVQRILRVVRPLRVVLFGSAGRGEMRADSDLDVLVIVPSNADTRMITRRIYRALIGFSQAADVIVATEDEIARYGGNFSLVYYPALRDGREIYAA